MTSAIIGTARASPGAGVSASIDAARLLTSLIAGVVAKLLRWLGFVATEVHEGICAPVFSLTAPDSVKAYARERATEPLSTLERRLDGLHA